MSPANAEHLRSPESGVKKPEAPKTPERAEHKLRIPEIGEKLKIYDASGNERAEVVVAADEKEGLIIVGHKTGGETRVREVMPGESNSRERAEQLNEKLNKAFESAAESAVKALMLKGAVAERMRERLMKSRELTVAKAASADAPEATITGAIEAMTKEKKEAKEAKIKSEMERGIQETRLEVLSKRAEVARLRTEVQKAEKAENDAAFKKAKKAFDKASKSLHSQERALVQLEEYASPKEDVEEIADRTEGAVEIKPKPVYSEGVAEVERGIDFAESRMRELDKILENDPKNITALNEWNRLNYKRKVDRVVLGCMKREEDRVGKEKEIEALRAETEAMDKKELAEAKKQLKAAEKAGDDKKAEQLLARVHELEQPAEDTDEIKVLQKGIAAIEETERQLIKAAGVGLENLSKGVEEPTPEEPYLDEEILSRPPLVPEDIMKEEIEEAAAEAERKEKEKALRDILANVKSNRREAPRPKAEKPKEEEKQKEEEKPKEKAMEEEIPIDTSEFEKPEEEPSIVVSPEAYPKEKHTPGSEVEKIDVGEVVKRVAEQRLKKEEKEHGMMLEAASKGLDIPASKIERTMAAFKNAKLWEQFRKASDTIPEKKGTAKLAFWKKEKSERQKVWEEIQDAAKEAGVDLTKAGKKRAR